MRVRLDRVGSVASAVLHRPSNVNGCVSSLTARRSPSCRGFFLVSRSVSFLHTRCLRQERHGILRPACADGCALVFFRRSQIYFRADLRVSLYCLALGLRTAMSLPTSFARGQARSGDPPLREDRARSSPRNAEVSGSTMTP